MEHTLAAGVLITAGLGLHLAAPTLAWIAARKWMAAERVYDLCTIAGAALCVVALVILDIAPALQDVLPGAFIALPLGTIVPLALWVAHGKIPRIRRPVPTLVMIIPLVLCATAEELIWRFTIIQLIHSVFDVHVLVGALVSVVGFAMMHVGLHGLRSFPYFLLFGSATILLSATLGIGAAIGFHVGHNLVLAFSQPQSRTDRTTAVGSETDW